MDEVFGECSGRGKGSEGEVLVEFWVGRGALEEEIGVLGGLPIVCRSYQYGVRYRGDLR